MTLSRPLRLGPHPAMLIAGMDRVRGSKPLVRCDVCNTKISGEPAGHGYFLWTRGEERRTEEPALCDRCALAITAAGMRMWDDDLED